MANCQTHLSLLLNNVSEHHLAASAAPRAHATTKELIMLAGGPPIVVVLNAVPFRGTRHEQATKAVEGLGLTVCPQTLGLRAAFGDSAAFGQSALEYEPTGKAAAEIHQVYEYVSLLLDTSASRTVDNDQKTRSRKRAG